MWLWWFIWGVILPACLAACYIVLRRLSRGLPATAKVERAREHFRYRREWLEAHFLSLLEREDPIERLRWEDASWHDEVVWARDRQTGRLLALIGVHFGAEGFEPIPELHGPQHATVIFEYAHGRWRSDGRRLDQIYPHEAFLRHLRYEPVVAPPQRRA
jgi:hypothetical protein